MSEVIIYPKTKENALMKNPINVGIDLGTTYSLMAIVDAKYVNFNESSRIPVQFITFPQYSPFEYDQTIEDEKLASIIAYYENRPFVGNNLYHLKGHPNFNFKKNIFYHWKVEMGIDHNPFYPDAVTPKLDMPYKIAGSIMNYMRINFLGKEHKETKLGNTIITVPASFQANQRKDTLAAAEQAKIVTNETMLVDEPNAAFLGYFNRLTEDDKEKWALQVKNKNLLVVDFGGGTLDLSLLNVDFSREKGIAISNKAISRYNDLGGQDIDLLIAEEYLLPKAKQMITDFDTLAISTIKQAILPQLTVIAEDLKKGICDKMSFRAVSGEVINLNLSEIIFSRLNNTITALNNHYDLGDIQIDGEKFKDLFLKIFRGRNYKFKYFDKTITTISSSISEIVDKAGETLDTIDFVLLVGGSSFNPLMNSFIKDKLNNAELLISAEPDKLVAEGAAVYSFFLNQYNTSLICPITSDDIGVRLKGDRFYPIIERGQRLPQKVSIPDFRLQSNMMSEIIVPVCINGTDFPIGEIKCPLHQFYEIDTVIKIKSEITIDKVFKIEVIANDKVIGEGAFNNPYAIGKLSEEQLEIYKIQTSLNEAKNSNNIRRQKQLLLKIIQKHGEIKNYIGVLENVELYIKRYDDQNSWVWNMMYIANSRLGRLEAAIKSLKRAIELSPETASWRYNYSLLLEKSKPKKALDYLEEQNEDIKKYSTIRCKIALLKNKIDQDKDDAKKIVEEYKDNPHSFSNFDKQILLKDIFEIVNEPYAFTEPNTERKNDDDSKYLDTNNLPI